MILTLSRIDKKMKCFFVYSEKKANHVKSVCSTCFTKHKDVATVTRADGGGWTVFISTKNEQMHVHIKLISYKSNARFKFIYFSQNVYHVT